MTRGDGGSHFQNRSRMKTRRWQKEEKQNNNNKKEKLLRYSSKFPIPAKMLQTNARLQQAKKAVPALIGTTTYNAPPQEGTIKKFCPD